MDTGVFLFISEFETRRRRIPPIWVSETSRSRRLGSTESRNPDLQRRTRRTRRNDFFPAKGHTGARSSKAIGHQEGALPRALRVPRLSERTTSTSLVLPLAVCPLDSKGDCFRASVSSARDLAHPFPKVRRGLFRPRH